MLSNLHGWNGNCNATQKLYLCTNACNRYEMYKFMTFCSMEQFVTLFGTWLWFNHSHGFANCQFMFLSCDDYCNHPIICSFGCPSPYCFHVSTSSQIFQLQDHTCTALTRQFVPLCRLRTKLNAFSVVANKLCYCNYELLFI